MSSDKDVSTKIRSLLDDAIPPRLFVIGAEDGREKAPNKDRIRPYTIFLLVSAVFLQLMSSQIAQAGLSSYLGVLSILCFLWGASRLITNESGFSSIGAALTNLRNRRE